MLSKTVKQLQKIAKSLKLKGFWGLKKAKLITLLEQNSSGNSVPNPEIVSERAGQNTNCQENLNNSLRRKVSKVHGS